MKLFFLRARKLLAIFLIPLIVFPVSPAFSASGLVSTPSPQSQSVSTVGTELNSEETAGSTGTPASPSQGGGYQQIPPSSQAASSSCGGAPVLNAMANAQNQYMNKASRGVSKHMSVMQVLAQQLDICAKNFLKFAFGLSNSLPTWSMLLDQILAMACSMAGQALYDALMCLINGALYGALTGKPFGFCGGYVINAGAEGGLSVNPQTGQLEVSATGTSGNSSVGGAVSGNATPNIGTGASPTLQNSTYNAGATYAPGQGTTGSYAGGTDAQGGQITPSDGVAGTLQKLFQ